MYEIDIQTIDDVVRWREVLLLLGVRRTESLLPHLGIPLVLACPSGQLSREAIACAGIIGPTVAIRGADIAYRANVHAAITAFFELMCRMFGDDVASELHCWATRNIVDPARRNCWWVWSILFPRLARISVAQEAIPGVENEQTVRGIIEIVQARFSREARTRQNDLFIAAKQIPLTTEETELLALPATQPTDFLQTDLLEIARAVMLQQGAYETWSELWRVTNNAQWVAITEWGRIEAKAKLGMPTGMINQPSSGDCC